MCCFLDRTQVDCTMDVLQQDPRNEVTARLCSLGVEL